MKEPVRLNDIIRINGKNNIDVAAELGINVSTLYRKMRRPSRFTISEAIKLKEMLNLDSSDISRIFFNN